MKEKHRQVMSCSRRKQHFTCLCEKIPVKMPSDLQDKPKEPTITYISISLFKLLIPGITSVFPLVLLVRNAYQNFSMPFILTSTSG